MAVTGVGAIDSAEAFGGATLYWVVDAFGTPNVLFILEPIGIASAETFGTATVTVGAAPGSTAITNAGGINQGQSEVVGLLGVRSSEQRFGYAAITVGAAPPAVSDYLSDNVVLDAALYDLRNADVALYLLDVTTGELFPSTQTTSVLFQSDVGEDRLFRVLTSDAVAHT